MTISVTQFKLGKKEALLIIARKQVTDRKVSTQTRFRRLSYPSFNGEILSYLEFKKKLIVEVVPERKPPALKLPTL